MKEFVSAEDWIIGMPMSATSAQQVEYIRVGLGMAEKWGSSEDLATLGISLASKLNLADRPEDAVSILDRVDLAMDLRRGGLPRMLAECYLHAGDAVRGLHLVFLGFGSEDPGPASPSEFEERKRRRVLALCIAARCGTEQLREQLLGMASDIQNGYVFQNDLYPISTAELADALKATSIDWLIGAIVTPYDIAE